VKHALTDFKTINEQIQKFYQFYMAIPLVIPLNSIFLQESLVKFLCQSKFAQS